MPVILIECLFAESSDSKKYNAEVIAEAIADALAGDKNYKEIISWELGWNKNETGMWYCTDVEKVYYYNSQNGW